jgi:hypothetical protein
MRAGACLTAAAETSAGLDFSHSDWSAVRTAARGAALSARTFEAEIASVVSSSKMRSTA